MSAIPVKENERNVEEPAIDFDIASAKEVFTFEEAKFRFLDVSNVWMDVAKASIRGVIRIPGGFGSGLEFLGRDLEEEAKAKTIPLLPFPGIKSIPWLRIPVKRKTKVGLAIDNFFIRFGGMLAEWGKTAKDFYYGLAEKGQIAPNPAILMGWKYPFRKVMTLTAENLPMLGLAAGTTMVTLPHAPTFAPVIGASIFFPAIAGDMYEDAIRNGVDPLRAADLAYLTGMAQTALETIPLKGWLKGGHIAKRILRVSIQESLFEEGTQQGFDNTLRIIGWREPRPIWERLTDGLAESILAGAVTGGILGAFQPPSINDIRFDLHNEITREGITQGLTEEQISRTIDEVDKVIDEVVGMVPPVAPPAVAPEELPLITPEEQKLHDQAVIKQSQQQPLTLEEEGIVEKVNQIRAFYSMTPDGEKIGSVIGKFGMIPKTIPPTTAKGEMTWEQTEPWRVNLGRDIAGIFEREIGPKLEVSKRMKSWLGIYYPMLGTNGLIRVRTLADEKVLFHETGHFLDDAISASKLIRKKAIREELVRVSKWIFPYEEEQVSEYYRRYRRKRTELFANFIAAYTLNPDICRQLAPVFTAEVENSLAKDEEFQYVITKLREFEEQMKPLKEYVNSLRKIPEFQPDLKDWSEKGNLLQQLWREEVGDRLWGVVSRTIDKLRQTPLAAFFEKGGLPDTIFEILRQRRKLIQGQQSRIREELVEPIGRLTEEEQRYISESLQRFEILNEDTNLAKLTEAARRELALWGNEARKLRLLNDETFWNNIGQYFPYFYEKKEFDKNKKKFGYFPVKEIRAKFAGLKHRLTDKEMGMRVLEAQYGTWPSAKKKIAELLEEIGDEGLERLGRNAREELGLIKTAAYPLQRRLSEMIEMVYTVKAFNLLATLPGIVGEKGMKGFAKMPSGRKYGMLAEKYVPESLVKEVSKWSVMQSELFKILGGATTVWKLFKVPYNPAAIIRNIISNFFVSWMGDVPIYNPEVVISGVRSFTKRDETYKLLRDRGLYRNTYSEQEMKELAFYVDQDPDNPWYQTKLWLNEASKVIFSPARIYGAIEDISKTIIARYVIDQGGTPEQAIKLADKLLFDYSQTSEVIGRLRQCPFPFITWSAKILPRLFEFAIRKPEKYLLFFIAVGIWNAISRSLLGIDREEEEELKPDYIRAKSVLLMPERDVNGNLNWVDLTFFLPWGSWLPVEKGKVAIPPVFILGSPLFLLYNAFVLNYDPFYKEIAPDFLLDDEKIISKGRYLLRGLGPHFFTQTPFRIIASLKPDRYRREKELWKTLTGEFLGLRFIPDISPYRPRLRKHFRRQFYEGRSRVIKQLRRGEITRAQAGSKIRRLRERLQEQLETH